MSPIAPDPKPPELDHQNNHRAETSHAFPPPAPEQRLDSGAASDDSDAQSCTSASTDSTTQYDQEPWPTFQPKVDQLAAQLVPGTLSSAIHVERMQGGGYNRIVGLSITSPPKAPRRWTLPWFRRLLGCTPSPPASPPDITQYILRIPRWNDSIASAAATLAFVGTQLSVPIPRVVASSDSVENALGMRYMLQPRLPGQRLDGAWPALNFAQKKCLAKQLAELSRNLYGLTHTSCCVLGAAQGKGTSVDTVEFLTLRIPPDDTHIDPLRQIPSSLPATPQTTLEFIQQTCTRWDVYERTSCHRLTTPWPRLAALASALHARGLLPSPSTFHFTHLDLFPRNILIVTPSPDTVVISGVLDWDDALFAPGWAACRMPVWLWTDDNADEVDEEQGLRAPETEEGRVLRRVFEEGVGDEFVGYACGRVYVLLRKVFLWMRIGLSQQHLRREFGAVLAELEGLVGEKGGEEETGNE
ncbi:hypothetical protein BDV95DRAFT_603491 [Massariosphaeria phaeospora]|uniref:Aminoglycoside phosphotransferase domain-containing protein n=1 Tax=Massariosphaeria phaeospora TaxID=100035 RepID=A0A7C8II10_9PLEO|nr:hypothetical protein BDV95DRAFT_603491 [Massariosphaeria phaeospora]